VRWQDDNDWSDAGSVGGESAAQRSARASVASAMGALTRGASPTFRFGQFHVDVARNSSDDFNPLHDPKKWESVRGNPYGSPVVSVFQMECLIEYLLRKGQGAADSWLIEQHDLHFCNYQFTFTGWLRPHEEFQVRIHPSSVSPGADHTLSNRVFLKTEGQLVVAGSVSQSASPLYLPNAEFSRLHGLERAADITYVPDTKYFLKRKYLSTGNAKNFVIACLADQAYYFDEVEDRVSFPDMVPVSFISSALFEKDMADNVDFRQTPMAHARHNISIDRRLARDLRSNDRLHLLVTRPKLVPPAAALGQLQMAAECYDCFGLVQDNQVLFRAQVFLVPLTGGRR